MVMYVVIVEDDYLQRDPIREDLEDAFPGIEVVTIKTELEFQRRLPEIRDCKPDVMIIDVMLRWADPQPNFPKPPPEIEKEGFYRAGLRCAQLVESDPILRDTPIILYTILEEGEIDREGRTLGGKLTHLRKGGATDILIRHVRELVAS
jgi:CheY-like chemotaxis protein